MALSDMNEIYLSPAPHVSGQLATKHIMAAVIVLLLPLAGYGIYLFGTPALTTLLLSTFSAPLFAAGFRLVIRRKIQPDSCAAAMVTGLMLAIVLPPATPWWMTLMGSFFAIIVAREFFGGLGSNVFNPALSGRAFLLMSFAGSVSGNAAWSQPFTTAADTVSAATTDVLTAATPLAAAPGTYSYADLFFGKTAGCIGETNALIIIIAFAVMAVTRIIDWRAPVAMVLTAVAAGWLFGGDPLVLLLSGGLLFGAVFMATDYATTPVTAKGRVIFGIGAGLITALIRRFGGYPEGVMFSILIMNVFTSFLNKCTARKYGYAKRKADK